MDRPILIAANGQFISGYFIFIECGQLYSDVELMEKLGIRGYIADPTYGKASKKYIHITSDSRWTHIIDGLLYSLWYSKTVRQRIIDLASLHNIFSCSRGDSDSSFDFEYYLDSKLRRRYVVEDPNWKGGQVTQDFGPPLPGEKEALKETDERTKVLRIAASLGIEINYGKLSIRSYSKPYDVFDF